MDLRIPYEPPGPEQIRAAILARIRREDERLADPAVRAGLDVARAEAAAAARVLIERFGAARVRLFGSLARRERAEGFDIDLAVEVIAPRLFFRACAEADQV